MADVPEQASGSDRLQLPPYRDARFYQKRKHGAYREVAAPQLGCTVADTHAHLHMLPDPALELARCALNGVDFVCMVADPSEDGSRPFDELDAWIGDAARVIGELREGADEAEAEIGGASAFECPRVPHVRIACGVHPHNARLYDTALERDLRMRLSDARVSALGEIGLDFHYDFSPRDVQEEVFRRQLLLAKEAGLPVALHVREAHERALDILCDEGFPEAGTLLHCCSLTWDELESWVEAGCYIAYGGALTFKKAAAVRAAAVRVPLNRVLTETDAPYMTPEPMRGSCCTPAHVVFTAACLADVRGAASADERAAFLGEAARNARSLLDREPTAWQRRFQDERI